MTFFGVTLGFKNSGFKSGLNEARADVKRFKAEASGSFGGIGGQLGSAIGGLISTAALKSVVDYGDRIADLSQRFGVSTETLQKWGLAAETNGSSLAGLASGFNKLIVNQSKALGGDENLRASFAALGVSIEDLKNLGPEALMEKIAGSGLNAADVVAVLGRSALELVPMLEAVADGSAKMGAAMSDAAIKGLAQASDAFKTITNQVTTWGGQAVLWGGKATAAVVAYAKALAGGAIGDFRPLSERMEEARGVNDAIWNPDEAPPPEAREQREGGDAAGKGSGANGGTAYGPGTDKGESEFSKAKYDAAERKAARIKRERAQDDEESERAVEAMKDAASESAARYAEERKADRIQRERAQDDADTQAFRDDVAANDKRVDDAMKTPAQRRAEKMAAKRRVDVERAMHKRDKQKALDQQKNESALPDRRGVPVAPQLVKLETTEVKTALDGVKASVDAITAKLGTL